MSNIIKFEELEGKLISYRDTFVLIDSDIAELYGVETRDINKAVKNNPEKFPDGYILELNEQEKKEVVENFHHLEKLKYSPHLPKIFTERGLYMLATIIKSKVATETTIKIIETFANIKKLSRNLNSINADQSKEEQEALIKESNILLEEIIDIAPIREIKDDETEIETKIELNLGFVKVSRVVKIKKNKEDYMNQSKKICVIGLGYIGLPTAALLANRGYEVHGVDVVQSTVDIINRGEIHIVEPGLDAFVQSAVNSGKLKADLKPMEADVFIIAVPTPFHEGYVPNVDYIVSATKAIAPYIKKGNIVILESTSPVGTTDMMEGVLEEEGVDTSTLYIAHCPERVLPGRIMIELVENDRIVGGTTPEATEATVEFYNTFVEGEVLSTDAKTAEMAKLTENSFRDTNIAFANELSILCDKFNIDVWELIALANRHPRVNILQPGAGVGGHCIAVDPWFIVHAGGEDAKMIRTAREVNTYKTEWSIEKIKNAALKFENENGRKAKVACMGLAFKPDIDDLRESPALYITRRLIADGLDVLAVEPNISEHSEFKVVDYNDALEQADIVTFLVAHKQFKTVDVKTELDFCGVLNK